MEQNYVRSHAASTSRTPQPTNQPTWERISFTASAVFSSACPNKSPLLCKQSQTHSKRHIRYISMWQPAVDLVTWQNYFISITHSCGHNALSHPQPSFSTTIMASLPTSPDSILLPRTLNLQSTGCWFDSWLGCDCVMTLTLGHYVQLNAKWVIYETFFPANLLTSTGLCNNSEQLVRNLFTLLCLPLSRTIWQPLP